jgi:putative ABC transport system permease protein
MTRWAPLTRVAWREARQRRLRSMAAVALIALPVGAGVVAAEISHNARWVGEQTARSEMGAADAVVTVTPYPSVRLSYGLGATLRWRPTVFKRHQDGRLPVRRDPAQVDIGDALPPGSVTTWMPHHGTTPMPAGGTALVLSADASSPLVAGIVSIAAGRAPATPAEAAVSAPMADTFDLVDDDGALRRNAELTLGDGHILDVVGVIGDNDAFGASTGAAARILVPPSSTVLTTRHPAEFLAGFPGSAPRMHALVSSLAAHGIAVQPRDVYFHPTSWGAADPAADRPDRESLRLGVIVGVAGMLEAIVLIASVFTVSVRRRLRDLGNLAAIGASPADLRRILLLQGLMLGCGGTAVGVASGLAAFRAALPVYADVSHHTVWTHQLDVSAALAVGVLGALSGVVASMLAACRLGTATVLEAITGATRERAAHRVVPVLAAMTLVGGGCLVAIGLAWHARTASDPWPDSRPALYAAAGLLLVAIGVGGLIPRGLRSIRDAGAGLPFSPRYALRSLARNVARTSTALVALMTMVAVAVLASFALASQAAGLSDDASTPPHGIHLSPLDRTGSSPEQVRQVQHLVEDVVGPVRRDNARYANRHNRDHHRRELDFVASRTVTSDDVAELEAHGFSVRSRDVDDRLIATVRLAVPAALTLLVLVVVALVVGLASAEGRAEASVLAAVGAEPAQGRRLGYLQGLLLGLIGAAAGAALGAVGAAVLQAVGAGTGPATVPWPDAGLALVAVPVIAGVAGAVGVQARTYRRSGHRG